MKKDLLCILFLMLLTILLSSCKFGGYLTSQRSNEEASSENEHRGDIVETSGESDSASETEEDTGLVFEKPLSETPDYEPQNGTGIVLASNTWIGEDGTFITLNPNQTGTYWEPGASRDFFKEGVQIKWFSENDRLVIPDVGNVFTIFADNVSENATSLTFSSDGDVWKDEVFTAAGVVFKSGFDIRESFALIDQDFKSCRGDLAKNRLDEIEKIIGKHKLIEDYRARITLFDNTCWNLYLGNGYASRREEMMFRLDGTYGTLNFNRDVYEYNHIDINQFSRPYIYENGILNIHIGTFDWDGEEYCWRLYDNNTTDEWDFSAVILYDDFRSYEKEYNSPLYQEKLQKSVHESQDDVEYILISNTWVGDGGTFLTLNPDNSGVYWEPGATRESFREGVPISWHVENEKLIIPDVGDNVFTIYAEDYSPSTHTLTFVSDGDIWKKEVFSAADTSFDSEYDVRSRFEMVDLDFKSCRSDLAQDHLKAIEEVIGKNRLIDDYRTRIELFDNTCWTMYVGRGYAGNFRALEFRLDGTFGVFNPILEIQRTSSFIDKSQFCRKYQFSNGKLKIDIREVFFYDGEITIVDYELGDYYWNPQNGSFVNENDPYITIDPDRERLYDTALEEINSQFWIQRKGVTFWRPELNKDELERMVVMDGCGFLIPEMWYEKCDFEYSGEDLLVSYKGYPIAEIVPREIFGGEFSPAFYPYTITKTRDGSYLSIYIKPYTYIALFYANYKQEYPVDDLKVLCELVTGEDPEFDIYLGMLDQYPEYSIPEELRDGEHGVLNYFQRTKNIGNWFFDHSWWE